MDLKYFGPTEEKYETELYCRLEFQPLNECEHGRESMRLKIKVCLGRVVQGTARCACVCVCGEHFSTGEVYIKGKWHEKAQNKIEQ